MSNHRGFTLVELMVALGVCIIIIGAIYAAVTTGQRSSSAMLQKVVAHQDARAALELMATDLQMVSFNPARAAGIWLAPTGTCSTASGNQNARGIQEATATSIAVEMDAGMSGAIGDSANEVIRYAYLPGAADQRITRSTNCGTAQPFLGSSVAGQKTVRVINDVNGNGTMDAGDLHVFRYYTALGTEIPVANFLNPAASPNVRDIARIEVTLSVETEDVAADTGQRRQMIYSTSIIPRNHVIP
jgi:type II secretory pathway pseudopilin PulG